MAYTEEVEDFDEDFEEKYDAMFGDKKATKSEYERDVVTGRRSKRPKMSVLNKSKVTKQELDDLFL